MTDATRFFLGYGERLTNRISHVPSGRPLEFPYSFEEARARLIPMVERTTSELGELPNLACPEDQAVGVITLHPQWMAKSYHPHKLLSNYNLKQVGSRPIVVKPERWTRQSETIETASSELYVSGLRENFVRWAQELRETPSKVPIEIQRLENVRAPSPEERIKNLSGEQPNGTDSVLLEVVLHAGENQEDSFILRGFLLYAESLGARTDWARRMHAGGLCFLPVEANANVIGQLAKFAFLRVARPMPSLRRLPVIERSVTLPKPLLVALPDEDAVDQDLRIALFDGGLAETTQFGRWAFGHEGRGVGSPTPNFLNHGHCVTSAVLFGSLIPNELAPRPYSIVDHYRVITDSDGHKDPFELFDVLSRIREILQTHQYEFINLSIGPDLPVEDDQVHTWTAILDEHLSDGTVLASIAIGNTGDQDKAHNAHRIQPPSDSVNALSVGAADSIHSDWKRAPYSSWGPGRSPGVVKPDIVQFGGDQVQEQFLVFAEGNAPRLAQTNGTSFAAPAALRLAAGIRAHFGKRISPLALKALLVHSADPSKHHAHEVGWGRIPNSVADISVCGDGMVRVIYQGELSPSHYLRAFIPLPIEQLLGNVTIEATFCYATRTDPQDPGSYTRSGLDITFRPHASKFDHVGVTEAKSKAFFKKSDFETEQMLRNDAQKWETTLNASKTFRSSSLEKPVFDIHYNARTSGGRAIEPDKIRYALVVTIRAKGTPNIYDLVVRAYAGQLEVLVPIVEVPIRI